MAEEGPKKVENETPSENTPPPPLPEPEVEAPKDVAEEKTVISPPAPAEDTVEESKAVDVVEKASGSGGEKTEDSANRDAILERVFTEKKISLIKAWEESEKSKAENKAHKKLSTVASWENSMKASLEAELRKIEEKLEKKKAEYAEKMKNKIAVIHKEAEEKKAIIEAKRGEDLLKAEEMAAKYRATGTTPKKLFKMFSS